jgi:DNA-3-methyladenine glycosylase I
LKKRDAYRSAFHEFDPRKVAKYSSSDVRHLLTNRAIIRNRLKILATITNARQLLAVQNDFGTFDSYVWRFVGGIPIEHRFRSMSAIPAKTKESDVMSRDMASRGFKFVGSTICYAFMQAVGMVNDHTTGCFRYGQV